MSETFGLGIIGAGNRVCDLLGSINQIPEMRVTAISDPCDQSYARALERLNYRPDRAEDSEALLAMSDVDGVIVATPNDTHAGIARRVLECGKALYLEKPMATTVEDCEALAECAGSTGARMMVGMQLRYSDVYVKMKRLADEGAIGDIRLIMFRALRGPFRGGVDGWRMRKQRSGGTILEVSVHQLDLFNWFAGANVRRVAGLGGRDAIYQTEELLDNAMMMVEYENGVKASLQAAVFAPQGGDPSGLCLVGDKGTMYHTAREIVVMLQNGDVNTYSTTGYAGMDAAAMRGFLDYAREGVEPLTSVEAGRDAVRLGILAEQAIERGAVITA